MGIIILPWKNNHTVALQTSASPISMPEDNRVLSNFEVRAGVDIWISRYLSSRYNYLQVMGLSATAERTVAGSKFVFRVKLERIFVSVLITTFLQTFVLWFLVYLTLFIDVSDFNNRF